MNEDSKTPKLNKESHNRALDILDRIRTMCVDLGDTVGQQQIEQIVATGSEMKLRGDELLLIMLDVAYKYIHYSNQINSLVSKMQKELEEQDSIPVNETNKKLN